MIVAYGRLTLDISEKDRPGVARPHCRYAPFPLRRLLTELTVAMSGPRCVPTGFIGLSGMPKALTYKALRQISPTPYLTKDEMQLTCVF